MIFPPATNYRWSMRKGDTGTDVGILQLNLGIPVDGDYGFDTEEAVLDWQEDHGLEPVDGIAGPMTQQSMVQVISRPIQVSNRLPVGILRSIAFNESSFKLANAGPHATDAGWDAGVFARSSGATFGTDSFYASAFNVEASATWTALNLRQQRDLYQDPVNSRYKSELAFENQSRFRWQLAVLSHNWPAAAMNICTKGYATTNDEMPMQWIVDATRGRLQTPRQWVMAYVAKATVFVQWKEKS